MVSAGRSPSPSPPSTGRLVVDARTATDLAARCDRARGSGRRARRRTRTAASPILEHRRLIADAVAQVGGGLDLLVNNASILGPSPQPSLADYPIDVLQGRLRRQCRRTAGLDPDAAPGSATTAAARSSTSPRTRASSRTRAGAGTARRRRRSTSCQRSSRRRRPSVRVYAFDPGDMRTRMHQEAFPGEDISDRPEPETVVPALLRLLERRPSERPLPGRRAASRPRTSHEHQDHVVAGLAVRAPRRQRGHGTAGATRSSPATACGSWSPGPAGSSTRSSAVSPDHLEPGDLLVVNTSATLPAAVDGLRSNGVRGSGARGHGPRRRVVGGGAPPYGQLRTADRRTARRAGGAHRRPSAPRRGLVPGVRRARLAAVAGQADSRA